MKKAQSDPMSLSPGASPASDFRKQRRTFSAYRSCSRLSRFRGVITSSYADKTIWQNQDGYLGNMYEFNENTLSTSDFDHETKTFAVPAPEYSDPDWTPEPSKLTQQQIRELVAEWLG